MSLEISGFKNLEQMFDNFSNNSILKPLVYKGAEVVADEMKKNLRSLKVDTKRQKTGKKNISEYEREVLLEAMGVSPISTKGGTINNKVGFDGYYITASGLKRPVPLLANSINAGTSFMNKQGFIDKTARNSKSKVYNAMNNQMEKIIKEEEK